jgi:hypothetical protein
MKLESLQASQTSKANVSMGVSRAFVASKILCERQLLSYRRQLPHRLVRKAVSLKLKEVGKDMGSEKERPRITSVSCVIVATD